MIRAYIKPNDAAGRDASFASVAELFQAIKPLIDGVSVIVRIDDDGTLFEVDDAILKDQKRAASSVQLLAGSVAKTWNKGAQWLDGAGWRLLILSAVYASQTMQ